ncbi:MAG: 50S ribosomal protein L9 [Buchnera aphidicola (Kaburagia rhusicola rhusicola)]
MQIVLLTKLENLGNLGDVIHVKSGYARNFLVPRGKAIPATPQNIALALRKKDEMKQKLLDKLSLAQIRAKKVQLVSQPIIIYSKSRKEGKLFGSIGSRDISELLSKLSGIEVKKREIYLSNGVFRKLGQYDVFFKPHYDVSIAIAINILSKEE